MVEKVAVGQLTQEDIAFLRAIKDTPQDNLPRLVYADYLQERGEEDRANMIRWMCDKPDAYVEYMTWRIRGQFKLVLHSHTIKSCYLPITRKLITSKNHGEVIVNIRRGFVNRLWCNFYTLVKVESFREFVMSQPLEFLSFYKNNYTDHLITNPERLAFLKKEFGSI